MNAYSFAVVALLQIGTWAAVVQSRSDASDVLTAVALIMSAATPVMLAYINRNQQKNAKEAKDALVITNEKVEAATQESKRSLEHTNEIVQAVAVDTKAIHVLSNDALTREKASRLILLKAQKILLEELLKRDPSDSKEMLVAQIEDQIEALEDEIAHRDKVAATIKPAGA